MIPRDRNAFLHKGKFVAGFFIASELLACGVTYYFYRQANRSPDYRFELLTKGRVGITMLESYYKVGEILNPSLKIRENDIALWRSQGKIE